MCNCVEFHQMCGRCGTMIRIEEARFGERLLVHFVGHEMARGVLLPVFQVHSTECCNQLRDKRLQNLKVFVVGSPGYAGSGSSG